MDQMRRNIPLSAPDREGQSSPGFKPLLSEKEFEKALHGASMYEKSMPKSLVSKVAKYYDVREIDVLESMYLDENAAKLIPRSGNLLIPYTRYRTVLEFFRDQTVTPRDISLKIQEMFARTHAHEQTVRNYFGMYPQLPKMFNVTVIEQQKILSEQITEDTKKKRIDYPTVYEQAIRRAIRSLLRGPRRKFGESLPANEVTPEIVRAGMQEEERTPLYAVRSYLAEQIRKNPSFIQALIEDEKRQP